MRGRVNAQACARIPVIENLKAVVGVQLSFTWYFDNGHEVLLFYLFMKQKKKNRKERKFQGLVKNYNIGFVI